MWIGGRLPVVFIILYFPMCLNNVCCLGNRSSLFLYQGLPPYTLLLAMDIVMSELQATDAGHFAIEDLGITSSKTPKSWNWLWLATNGLPLRSQIQKFAAWYIRIFSILAHINTLQAPTATHLPFLCHLSSFHPDSWLVFFSPAPGFPVLLPLQSIIRGCKRYIWEEQSWETSPKCMPLVWLPSSITSCQRSWHQNFRRSLVKLGKWYSYLKQGLRETSRLRPIEHWGTLYFPDAVLPGPSLASTEANTTSVDIQ